MNRPRRKDGHLPKCVYQKHGAYWHVKNNKWTPLGKDLKSALEKYAELFEAPESGIDQLIDETLEQHFKVAKVAKSTAAQYRKYAKYLKNTLREFKPEQVRPKHAIAIKRALASKPGKANCVLSLGKVLFGYWLEDEIVESNPFFGVKGYGGLGRKRLPTREEYDRVYAKADEELQIVMELWLWTGQRVVDVLRIRRKDCELDGPGIAFEQQKTGKRLIVKWTPELRSAVARAKALCGKIAALTLLHRHGKPLGYSTISRRWRVACKAAGVADFQRRDLRAMAASAARKQGKDPSKLLGHADPRTTKLYLRDKEIEVIEGPSFRQVLDN